jgi:hypothetical protein
MPLTLAQMLALFPDNTAGDISAADGRSVITAIVRRQRAPFSVDHADDTWWEGDIGDFTEVAPTGTATESEQDGFLSVLFSGQSSEDFTCFLKPVTFATGHQWVVPVRVMGISNHNMAGICFTDGTTTGSNLVAFVAYVSNTDNQTRVNAFHGTITSSGTAVTMLDGNAQLPRSDAFYLKLGYSASNTFQHWLSPDGISFSRLGAADISKTMTPTHVGVCVTKYGGSGDGLATFGPLCKVA